MRGNCQICGCECNLTLHHLIPQSKAKNKYKDTKDDPNNHLMICRTCHDKIHSMFTNQQLRDMFFTKELLFADSGFNAYVKWKMKHTDFVGSSKMSNDRRQYIRR